MLCEVTVQCMFVFVVFTPRYRMSLSDANKKLRTYSSYQLTSLR